MITIRVGELAQALGVHRNTIRNWIRSGKFEARPTVGKKYAIEKSSFLAFIDSQSISPDAVRNWIGTDAGSTSRQPFLADELQTKKLLASSSETTIGAVVVVGGGIAGIQASLDLADSGYYVYLVEKSPGIGGVMAKLDKTFPTNDCAM